MLNLIEEKNLVQKISSHRNSPTRYTNKEAKLILLKKLQWKNWRGTVLPEWTSMFLNTGNVTNEPKKICSFYEMIVQWRDSGLRDE